MSLKRRHRKVSPFLDAVEMAFARVTWTRGVFLVHLQLTQSWHYPYVGPFERVKDYTHIQPRAAVSSKGSLYQQRLNCSLVVATAYRMIIRCQCLLNNCRIPAFPRRIQIKPAENNPATTPQAFCGRRGYMALRGNTFYPCGDGPGNLGQGPGMHMQEERTQSVRRRRALPCSRRGSSLLPPALSAWGVPKSKTG